MRPSIVRSLAFAAMALWLAGCSSTNTLSDAQNPAASGQSVAGNEAFASATPGEPTAPSGGLLGDNPNDELSLGKKYYRDGDFGLAEKHFRRAAELRPAAAEAWLGLAASYDRLLRFDFADRAYDQAIRIAGPTAEILNNQGYSLMLRGKYKAARAKLAGADAKSPNNPYVKNNIRLLEEAAQKKAAVQ